MAENKNGAKATKVVTGEVRLSYAYLFVPRPNDQGKDTWSTLLLIPKSDKVTLRALKAAAEEALKEGLANGKLRPNTSLKNAWKTLKDGDERDDLEERPEYAGNYYMNVTAYRQPGIVDKRVQPILDSSEVYSGCYAKVSLNAYPYNSNGNRGVTFGLNHVQKTRDGEFLGGTSRAEDDFEALEDAEDDDILGGDDDSII